MEYVIYIALALTVIALSVSIFKRKSSKFVPPETGEEPRNIDGVLIGKYYGDPLNKKCVEVVVVEEGMVAFRYVSNEKMTTIMSMPKEAFVEKFYKYPNGCDFLTIEDDIDN